MKLALTAGALALSMALAGCGGGGSNSTAQTPAAANNGGGNGNGGGGGEMVTPEPDETTSSPVRLPTELPTDFKAPAQEEFTITAGSDPVVKGDISFTCPGTANCEVTVAADGAITSVGGTAMAALTSEASDRLKMQTAAKTDQEIRLAEGLFAALVLPPDASSPGVTQRLSGTTGETIDSPATVTRKMGENAVFKQSGYTPSAAPKGIDGWAGATLTDMPIDSNSRETIERTVVHSNIEAAKRVPFGQVYGENPTYRDSGNAAYYIEQVGANVFFDSDAQPESGRIRLTLPTGDGNTFTKAINGGRLAGRFPQTSDIASGQPSRMWTYTDDHATRKRSFAGTFHGASGNYSCTGDAACTVTIARNGNYTFGGTWAFEASAAAQAVIADVDYLQFGYWIDRPLTPVAGDSDYTVRLIGEGSQPYTAGARLPTSGRATYEGGATGVFAVRTTTGGTFQTASSGEFVAAAELTARWGANVTSSMLEGRIHSFEHAGTGGSDVDMDDWRVTLGRSPLVNGAAASGPTPAIPVHVGADATWAPATARLAPGTTTTDAQWRAWFYGPDSGADPQGAAPTGVVGAFRADFDTAGARIAGTFGATKTAE